MTIRPAQIASANAVFTRRQPRSTGARTVTAAFAEPENADKGAIRVAGKMVERLHLVEAARTIAIAERVGAG